MISFLPKHQAEVEQQSKITVPGYMKGRWRFRFVKPDESAAYATENGKAIELVGTDEEALEMSRQIAPVREGLLRVEAVSVGCPNGMGRAPGRLLAFVKQRADGKGWNLLGDLMSGTWHTSLEEAVGYAAFRFQGYVGELRIQNAQGTVTHAILIDQTEQFLGALFS